MHRPTDNLRADHDLTARGLRSLAAIGAHVGRGGHFPVDDCAVLLRFLREFVLAVHLRKEAELIYPAVAMRADDRAAELVGEVMRLNDEIHELTHTLIVFWEPVGELTPAERAGFAETVAALAARFTRLRTMEEAELFPSCDRAVPADDQLDWVRQFAQLEHERCSRADWQALLAPVAQRWLG